MNNPIEGLREALRHSPDNIPLRIMLIEALCEQSLYGEALEECKLVLQKNGADTTAKIWMATCYHKTGNDATAIVILEELEPSQSENDKYLLLYAQVLVKEGQFGKASQYYQKAKLINPSIEDAAIEEALRVPNLEADFGSDYNDEERDERFLENPGIDFEDVGGLDDVKKQIDLKIIKPLEHAEMYKQYGKKVGGGILLYGPPGCGKSHIASATAGQIKAKFISVSISDVLDMWIGNSEKNLHDIFELARANTPCVLFFDEVDALGASRTDMRQSAGKNLINQFLNEMDGIKDDNDGLLILGATNAPWHLDTAFRRPGRFDRIIFVPPPDEGARKSILDIKTKGKPMDALDSQKVAKVTKDFSGADLEAVVDIAIEEKLEKAFETGVPEPLRTKDLLKAAKKHRASTKEWFVTARNYALYSNESGIYDDILDYLNIKR